MRLLRLLRGRNAGNAFALDSERTVIGRDADADIVLDDDTVSRRHAQVVKTPDGYQLQDLGSRNGTLLNHQRVEGSANLSDGDLIQICDNRFAFMDSSSPPEISECDSEDVLATTLIDREAATIHSPCEATDVTAAIRRRCTVNAGSQAGFQLLSWSPQGDRLATTSRARTIQLWDTRSGELRFTTTTSARITAVALSADGNFLAAASSDRHVETWDCRTGQRVHAVEQPDVATSLAWSADGRMLASTSGTETVIVWHGLGGKTPLKLLSQQPVTTAVWSPDSQLLATCDMQRTVSVWTREGRSIGKFFPDVESRAINACPIGLAWCAQSRRIALFPVPAIDELDQAFEGNWPAIVLVCNFQTSQSSQTLTCDTGIAGAVWSRDSQLLALATMGAEIWIWRVAEQRCIDILAGHPERVDTLCFSQDQPVLLSKSLDGTLFFWNSETWRSCAALSDTFVGRLHVNADLTQFLVVSPQASTVHSWDVDVTHVLRRLGQGSG